MTMFTQGVFPADAVDAKFSIEAEDNTMITAVNAPQCGGLIGIEDMNCSNAGTSSNRNAWNFDAQSTLEHVRPTSINWGYGIVGGPKDHTYNGRWCTSSNPLLSEFPNSYAALPHSVQWPSSYAPLSTTGHCNAMDEGTNTTHPCPLVLEHHDSIQNPMPRKSKRSAILTSVSGATTSFCESDSGTWSSLDPHDLISEPSPMSTVSDCQACGNKQVPHTKKPSYSVAPTDPSYWSSTKSVPLRTPLLAVRGTTGQRDYWTSEGRWMRIGDIGSPTEKFHSGYYDHAMVSLDSTAKTAPVWQESATPVRVESWNSSQCQQPCCRDVKRKSRSRINITHAVGEPNAQYVPIQREYVPELASGDKPSTMSALPMHGPIRSALPTCNRNNVSSFPLASLKYHASSSGSYDSDQDSTTQRPRQQHVAISTSPSSAPRATALRPEDAFLVQAKCAGMSYKAIRDKGRYKEAESTLRGRFRSLTKHKHARVRRPIWTQLDIHLLKESVALLMPQSGPMTIDAPGKSRVPWKKVAERIVNKGGSYHFGNATCKKKWDDLTAK